MVNSKWSTIDHWPLTTCEAASAAALRRPAAALIAIALPMLLSLLLRALLALAIDALSAAAAFVAVIVDGLRRGWMAVVTDDGRLLLAPPPVASFRPVFTIGSCLNGKWE